MSKEWGYYCKNCDKEETWLNHGDEKLRQLFKAKKIIDDLGFDEIELSINKSYDSDIIEFLEVHENHNLCLINEYGEKESL